MLLCNLSKRLFLIKIRQVIGLTFEFLYKCVFQAKLKRIVRDLIIFVFCQGPVYIWENYVPYIEENTAT